MTVEVQSSATENATATVDKSKVIFEVQDLHLHYLTRFGNKIHAVSG